MSITPSEVEYVRDGSAAWNPAIIGGEEDDLTIIAALGDVMGNLGQHERGSTGHAILRGERRDARGKRLSPFSLFRFFPSLFSFWNPHLSPSPFPPRFSRCDRSCCR
jgi:hypothetical protein